MLGWLVRLAAGCGLLSLADASGESFFVLDQIANFRVQYVYALLVALAVAIIIRAYMPATIMMAVIAIHGFSVARMYIPVDVAKEVHGDNIQVMSTNLLVSNTNFKVQVDNIYRIDPDVIVFQEYSSSWDAVLSKQLTSYPFRVSEIRDSPFGIALYSRFPITSSRVVTLGDSTAPNLDTVVNVDSQQIRILGVHPPPPVSARLFDARNSQLAAIAEAVADEKRPTIVLGDLNTTPWSVHFGKLLRTGNLQDARRGFGILPTWPSRYPVIQIPIDHILVNSEILVTDVGTISSHGSDHKSIWAELELAGE